jgi:type II secretory pathway pseudopilin PulG
MVIVILGVLAAVGIPRFLSLRADAIAAKLIADMGALQSGVLLVKAKWEVSGQPASVTVNGQAIGFYRGWPTASGVKSLLDLNAAGLYAATVNSGTGGGAAFGPKEKSGISVSFSGVVNAGPCQFSYNEPQMVGSEPTWDASQVNATLCAGI